MPAGTNVIVAIASYTGYNQEDSLLINASAIDKGLYVANSLKKEHVDLDKNSSASQVETFMKPDPNKVEGMKVSNYDKLNEKGYVQEETRIEDNDVIVGICTPIPPGPNSDKTYRDSSRIYKATLPATVNKVYADITNQDGYPALTMSLRSIRHPNIGDKFASRSGQKATIGLKLHRSDMPFTSRGIIPDIIINPNCIPGRMTAGHLIEMLKAKVCVAKGQLGDGSPFGEESVKKLNDELIAMGFMKYANDIMYNGMTGQRMEVPIFIAPIYYLRLKHMVYDKVHSRDRGPVQILTRAPTEGRSRDGGLRFGEMERDAICAHGAAQFLKERLVDVSDPYVARICNICGMFAHKAPDHNYYICTACTNTTRISTVVIPYAWKLFTQELMSMNILPRMRTRRALGNVK
jgi:DNA-directed RNA polymerase II subunit RPB2